MADVIRRSGRPLTHYFLSGRRFVDICHRACSAVRTSLAEDPVVLDYGCGHGRLTRHMSSVWHPRRLIVADVWPEAVAFCAREFAAEPLVIKGPGSLRRLAREVDVVVACSVFSHLPPKLFVTYLRCLRRVIKTDGVVAVTTHGVHVAQAQGVELADDCYFGTRGTGKNHTGGRLGVGTYAFMAVAPSFVERAARASGLKVVRFEEGVVGGQDLYVLQQAHARPMREE
ncbi:MAG: class I SAM-dependent methyltransferase [Planctomycetes bacterium]|nr:class I SAM-dependent methyltransferase [Planctomycetota bacterium]